MVGLSKRGVQFSLGGLWIIDGLLQLQPRMFTSRFASQVISPAAAGQPGFVSGPIHFGLRLFLSHPAVFDSLFALTQLSIGFLILMKRTLKWGLILSAFWGLVVWVFGEAYSGLLSGHTLLLMGAPGAALIYVVLSLAVLPSNENKPKKQNQPAYWLVLFWALFWVIGGIYQLLPGQNTTTSVSSMLSMNASSAPSWLASLDNNSAHFVKGLGGTSTHIETAQEMNMSGAQMANMSSPAPTITKVDSSYWFIILLALIQFLIGIAALFKGLWRQSAIWFGIVLSLLFWVVGQSFGALYSGLATDPSTGPLFVLMGLAILGCTDLDKHLSSFWRSLEKLTVGNR